MEIQLFPLGNPHYSPTAMFLMNLSIPSYVVYSTTAGKEQLHILQNHSKNNNNSMRSMLAQVRSTPGVY